MMFLMSGVLHPRFCSPIISLATYPVDSSNLCWTTPRLISHICLTIHDPRDQSWFICVSPNLLTIINDQHLPKVHYCSRYINIQLSAAYVDIPLLDLDRNHPIIMLVIDTLYPIYTPFISQPSDTIQPYALVIVGRWSNLPSLLFVLIKRGWKICQGRSQKSPGHFPSKLTSKGKFHWENWHKICTDIYVSHCSVNQCETLPNLHYNTAK